MKAIQTRFIPPTAFKGSRVKAWDSDGNSVTLSWDHSLPEDENNHVAAVRALCKKMGWEVGTFAMGGIKGGWVFVLVTQYNTIFL
jgi:hypothetical protein